MGKIRTVESQSCKHGTPYYLKCYQCENDQLEKKINDINEHLADVIDTRDHLQGQINNNYELIQKACGLLEQGLIEEARKILEGFKGPMEGPRDSLHCRF